jgi:hypothetical protein
MNSMGDMPAFSPICWHSTNIRFDSMTEINIEMEYLTEDERELLDQIRKL